jgi:hypothetical protein
MRPATGWRRAGRGLPPGPLGARHRPAAALLFDLQLTAGPDPSDRGPSLDVAVKLIAVGDTGEVGAGPPPEYPHNAAASQSLTTSASSGNQAILCAALNAAHVLLLRQLGALPASHQRTTSTFLDGP